MINHLKAKTLMFNQQNAKMNIASDLLSRIILYLC